MSSSPAPLAVFWGDDDLAIARAVERMAEALGREAGSPLERWEARGENAGVPELIGRIVERVSTPVMFGGGTLAVISNVGPLVRRSEHRDALLGGIAAVADGNGIAFVEATATGAKSPPNRKLADAVSAAGGVVREFRAPKAGGLAAWIEAEARERGVRLGAGAAKELATRIGGFVQEGDADRRHQTRIASGELDKLGLYRGDAVVEVADVRALVAEAVPGSVWAFVDAVAERRATRAIGLLDRLLATTAEPVLTAVLHRRMRELLEIADRVAAGEALPAVARAMRIPSEFRMRTLAGQARAWTTDELAAALSGVVELDAMVKGAPGSERDEPQRRLAFSLWVLDHAGGRAAAVERS
jgi:DNA polymerase III delta subunit